MAILTTGYVDLAIGTSTRVALAPTTAAFVQFEAMARVAVQAAAQVRGYSVSDSSTNAMVRLLALSQWFGFAGGFRKGIKSEIAELYFGKLEDVRLGNLPIPGLTPSSEDDIGGTKASDTSDTSADARVQYFSRAKLATW